MSRKFSEFFCEPRVPTATRTFTRRCGAGGAKPGTSRSALKGRFSLGGDAHLSLDGLPNRDEGAAISAGATAGVE